MCRFGWEFTRRLVRSITQTGTRLFCLVTLRSLCFFANGLFLAIKHTSISSEARIPLLSNGSNGICSVV